MWLPLIAWLALAATASQPRAELPGPKPDLPPPVATRQNLFAIPFRIDRVDVPAQEPVEVQLYVSGDRGAYWQLYSKVEPARQQFMFRAGGDGEYWFLVRTLDRSGRLRPEGLTAPGLRVVVDTAPPNLQVSASRGQDGQITARWRIDEPNPKPDSLKIEYRTADNAPWQPVAIDRQRLNAAGPVQEGEVTWWPQGSSGEMQIRAEVGDAAGNLAVSHARVKLEGAAGSESSPAGSSPAAADASSPWRGGTESAPASNWPADRTTTTPFGEKSPTGVDPNFRSSPGGPPATNPPTDSVAADVNPAIRNRYAAPDQPAAMSGPSSLPPGERPRMINSRSFELEYDINTAEAAGAGRVELWGTKDGGRNWKRYATQTDNHGPLLVSVDEEGIYGFRIALKRGGGKGGAPKSGDLPEAWIGVDLTNPTGRITSTQPGSGMDAGKLVICWEAADNVMLAARPVALLFSEAPGGPWTTLAAGLENTGRYAWPIDSRLPERVFLRLEVRDEAGNLGVFDSSQAVTLDRSRPPVYIREVRPVGQSSRAAPKRYILQ